MALQFSASLILSLLAHWQINSRCWSGFRPLLTVISSCALPVPWSNKEILNACHSGGYQWLIQALVENQHKPHNWQLLTLITVFVCVKVALILKYLLFSAAVAWCLTLSRHHSIPLQSATKISNHLSSVLSVITCYTQKYHQPTLGRQVNSNIYKHNDCISAWYWEFKWLPKTNLFAGHSTLWHLVRSVVKGRDTSLVIVGRQCQILFWQPRTSTDNTSKWWVVCREL